MWPRTIKENLLLTRNVIIPLCFGNFAKLLLHTFYLHEEYTFFFVGFSALVVYAFSTNKRLAGASATLAFATHEYWFENIGSAFGLVYNQYPTDSFIISALGFGIIYLGFYASVIVAKRILQILKWVSQ